MNMMQNQPQESPHADNKGSERAALSQARVLHHLVLNFVRHYRRRAAFSLRTAWDLASNPDDNDDDKR